jgi:hypothetical protein
MRLLVPVGFRVSVQPIGLKEKPKGGIFSEPARGWTRTVEVDMVRSCLRAQRAGKGKWAKCDELPDPAFGFDSVSVFAQFVTRPTINYLTQ